MALLQGLSQGVVGEQQEICFGGGWVGGKVRAQMARELVFLHLLIQQDHLWRQSHCLKPGLMPAELPEH